MSDPAPKAQADHELMPHFNQSGEDMFECRKCESIAHRKYFEKWPCNAPIQPETKAPQEREATGLRIPCDSCGNILDKPGVLKFVPTENPRLFEKFHYCVKCEARKEREL